MDYSMRIITFNILTHEYCYESHYKFVNPEYIDNEFREKRLLKLLSSWMKANFIINLQEVGFQWKILLDNFFKANNYEFVTEIYADGILGVGIAFPKNHFKLDKIISEDLNLFLNDLKVDDKEIQYEYDSMKNKETMLLGLGLKCFYKGSNTYKKIMVMSCHLPLKYRYEYYMMTILWKIRNICYNLEEDYNIILTGDFNMTPNSMMYNFMLDKCDNDKLVDLEKIIGEDFNKMIKLKSAYNECHKTEPNYTNVYKSNKITFCDCLDYIFISDKINIISSIVGLLNNDPMKYLYPNAICPSDHVPLSASLSI